MAARKAEAKKAKIAELEAQLRRVRWRDLTFVGTELANVAVMRKEPFEFPALETALQPGGALHGLSHPVYLFAVSEPVYLKDAETILNVPVIVAFSSAVPPPSLVCHDSVQSTDASTRALNPLGGRPLSMRSQQLAWVPYVPAKLRDAVSLSLTPSLRFPLVALTWEERSSRTKRMTEDQVHYLEYLNPYIVLPQVCDALEKPEVRNVDFRWQWGDQTVDIVFDKDIDRLAEFIPDTIEKHKLPEDCKDSMEQAIREAFKKARVLADEQWEELQSKLKGLSETERKALLEAKIYKFYPSHPAHDLRAYLSPRVNRYYGNANFVLGGDPIPKRKSQDDLAVAGEEETVSVATTAPSDVQGEPAAKRSRKQDA